jgi:hypothetical protein
MYSLVHLPPPVLFRSDKTSLIFRFCFIKVPPPLRFWKPSTYLKTPNELIKLVNTGHIDYHMEFNLGANSTYYASVYIQWREHDTQHDDLTWVCGIECEEAGVFVRSTAFTLRGNRNDFLLPRIPKNVGIKFSENSLGMLYDFGLYEETNANDALTEAA